MNDDKKTNPTMPAFMSAEAVEAARPMFSPWYMCTCERIPHLSTCPRSKLPDEVLAALTTGRSLLKHVAFLTPPSVDREALGLRLASAMDASCGIIELVPGATFRGDRVRYTAGAVALYSIGYAEAMSTIASFTAPGELPALETQHTPTEDRFDGEVWRGRVLVDDEWVHAGVAMVNGFARPLFFAYGNWREPAHGFGYKVMSAWALAQRATGRSEGEALGANEIARLEEVSEDLRVVIAERDASIVRLTAEVEEAQAEADAMQARAILAEAKERRQ